MWGIELSTETLPEQAESYNREDLARRLNEIRKALATDQDSLQAAKMRFVADAAEMEWTNAQIFQKIEAAIAESAETRRRLLDENIRLDNDIVTLQSQFDQMRGKLLKDLQDRDTSWKQADMLLQKEESDFASRLAARTTQVETDFATSKAQLDTKTDAQRIAIEKEEFSAREKRDAEFIRVEAEFQRALSSKGIDTSRVAAAETRGRNARAEIERIPSSHVFLPFSKSLMKRTPVAETIANSRWVILSSLRRLITSSPNV